MTLIYLALVYIVGLYAGHLAWQQGWVPCDFPVRLWVVPMMLMPWTILADKIIRHGTHEAPLRWPEAYGFVRPGRSFSISLAVAMLCSLMAGGLRYISAPAFPCLTASDLASYNVASTAIFDPNAPVVEVEGTVVSYVEVGNERQRFQVDVTTLVRDDAVLPVRGRLMASIALRPQLAYGQPIRLRGRLGTPAEFPDFSYRSYLARRNVHSVMYGPEVAVLDSPPRGSHFRQTLYSWRARGEEIVNRSLSEPYAALANGILLGTNVEIPDDLHEAFVATSTSHVLVISGSNIAMLAAFALLLFGRFLGYRQAVLPVLAILAIYATLVGGDAAVVRAAVMGGLAVIAVALQRTSTALVSLAVACWAMTLANPLALWDVGFQLSAAATVGLILLAPQLLAILHCLWPGMPSGTLIGSAQADDGTVAAGAMPIAGTSRWFQGLIMDSLAITLAANIMVLPLLAYYFGRISLLGMLANLLIAPVQPLIMAGGSAGIVAGLAGLNGIAQVLLWIVWLGFYWTVSMVEMLASLPGASIVITWFGPPAVAASYAIIVAGIWGQNWWKRKISALARFVQADVGQRTGESAPAWLVRWLAGTMAVGTVLVWWAVFTLPDGHLHVWFLDVGQGDGILIQTPSGRQVLIDGGSSAQTLFAELGAVMPFWDRSLDLLVLTHPDGDHMDAQAAMPGRFRVGQALDTSHSQRNPEGELWRASLADAQVSVRLAGAGGWVDLGDGAALWVLWPLQGESSGIDDDNERSLVLKLVYGNFSALLTGDTGIASEAVWLRTGLPLRATVLKVGHHGSSDSTSTGFVAAVDPMLAVIQSGAGNPYGHPSEKVLANLAGHTILRTDLHGRVHVYSDGTDVWIEHEDVAK